MTETDSNLHRRADSVAHADQPLQRAAIADLLKVFGTVMRFATSDWITLDLSSAQIKVLFTLHYGGAFTINQLADRLNVGASTASHLADKLVQAGLAMRTDSIEDRRIVHVQLTAEGHDMARRLWGGRDAALTHWMAQLAPDDLAALNQGIHALYTIMGQSDPPQAPQT